MSVISDPIGDMLVRIKNAYRAKKETVLVPHSNVKQAITELLKAKGYIADFEKKGKKVRKFLELTLKYSDGAPAVKDVRRVSKPSRRLYIKASDIKQVKYGYGIAIISTPQGLMTNHDAKQKKLGGEILAEVW
ncbi:MAG: 30S ribosomal protein S8 [Candidatus Sungbacteria bacterium RIFCSPHIGHO2_02_FULL_49_12]|uniref:Small ribosomal subunit protein uS8 n=1 Tax=Candidatus Sungbacteria bacterium RIFCSPHIGHO2_02_FULL_49_12 TaxID=1802271 RepID=A0A1G2KM95_9BACT|nr:MAG: 30S ribosomal protein S8 [Candidatus Sungbacteria bacterium RIFCSPHIGHO2_02_FULL_49_12]